MKKILVALTVVLIAIVAFTPLVAKADTETFNFNFDGNGITADGTLVATEQVTPGVWDITSVNGLFSDSNIGVSEPR